MIQRAPPPPKVVTAPAPALFTKLAPASARTPPTLLVAIALRGSTMIFPDVAIDTESVKPISPPTVTLPEPARILIAENPVAKPDGRDMAPAPKPSPMLVAPRIVIVSVSKPVPTKGGIPNTALAVIAILPPLLEILLPGLNRILLPLSRLTFNGPTNDVMPMPGPKTILPTALSVSVAPAPPAFVILAPIKISPMPPPVGPVCNTTLVPAFNWASMSVFRTFGVAAPDVNVAGDPGENVASVGTPGGTPLTSRSAGSSNHCPALPRGAAASARSPATSIQWPEVSMRPPSPPSTPPRADKDP